MTTNLNKLGLTLARNAALMRKESGLSLKQLSEFTTISVPTLRSIEAARVNRRAYRPMFHTVVKLAGVAGVTVEQLTQTNLKFV